MPYNVRMARERIFLGLCSGWSADGVDAALLAVRGRGEKMKLQQLHALHRPLDGAVRSRIVAAQGEKDITASALFALDGELADAFAAAGNFPQRGLNVLYFRLHYSSQKRRVMLGYLACSHVFVNRAQCRAFFRQ